MYIISMPEEGVFKIRKPKDRKWVEVRGTYDVDPDSPFQKLIDVIPGPKSATMFADQENIIKPSDSGYKEVHAAYMQGNKVFETKLKNILILLKKDKQYL